MVSTRCWVVQLFRVRLGGKKWYCFMAFTFQQISVVCNNLRMTVHNDNADIMTSY